MRHIIMGFLAGRQPVAFCGATGFPPTPCSSSVGPACQPCLAVRARHRAWVRQRVDQVGIQRLYSQQVRALCPDCGGVLQPSGGCLFCPRCGWSAC